MLKQFCLRLFLWEKVRSMIRYITNKQSKKGKCHMSEQVITYLNENREQLLQRLKTFLTIPSVSTDTSYKEDVKKAAQFIRHYLDDIGFENIEEIPTNNHPVVYAEYNGAGHDAPTVLRYALYNVQPVDPIEDREPDRVLPEISDGRLHARGPRDDKGQVLMHSALFEAFRSTKRALPVQVKVRIDGAEEAGSKH